MRYADNNGPGNPIAEGDPQFVKMNLKADRTQLQVGECYEAMNKRLARGVAETRPGTVTPKWANIVPFSAILGAGVYSNPNGLEVMLIATTAEVLMIRCGAYPTSVAIPAGTTLAGAIEFSQHFDQVLLERADGGQTLAWDGVNSIGFVAIAQSNPLDTTRAVTPSTPWSVNMGGRRIFPVASPESSGPLDALGVSDLLDYTSYDPLLGVYRVNAGTADGIVGAYPYQQSSIVIGKRRSIDLLRNFIGDLSQATMEVLSTEIGMVSRRATRMIGADLLFLSDTGVYRISQVIQNLVQTQPVAVSDPIEPLIRRINWSAADKACAAVLGFYYILFVPLDGSTVNNTALVYNTVTDGWESWDQWNATGLMQIDYALVTNYQGQRRIYAANAGTKSVHVLYEGMEDELANGATFPISDLLRTRAYAEPPTIGYLFARRGFAEYGPKEFLATEKDAKQVAVALRTWRPRLTVTLVSEGMASQRALTPAAITKDRTKYYRYDLPDYDPSNSHDDFQTAGRQDYSVRLPDPSGLTLGTGVILDQRQERKEKFSLRARSRWFAFDLANVQGTCDVLGVIVESGGVRDQRRRGA